MTYYCKYLTDPLFQANTYFQASTRQGRAYRDENVTLKKENETFDEKCRDLESRAIHAEADAHSLQQQYDSLYRKKAADYKLVVKAYQESEDFLQLIDKHDDEVRPGIMSVGWDKAVNAVSKRHPIVVDPRNFPSLYGHIASGSGVNTVAQASGSGSRGSHRRSGSGSRGGTQSVQRDSSSFLHGLVSHL